MRNLIRPTLFLFARLAIFFAIVAWIVGPRWHFHTFVRAFGETNFTLQRDGWFLTHWRQGRRSELLGLEFELRDQFDRRTRGLAAHGSKPRFWIGTQSRMAGVEITTNFPGNGYDFVWSIRSPHYAVALLFVTLYLALKLIYVKRPKVR